MFRDEVFRRFNKAVFIDLGANTYTSSIGGWLRARYPRGDQFKVYAFEAERYYDQSYLGHPDVELLHYAVWKENTTM